MVHEAGMPLQNHATRVQQQMAIADNRVLCTEDGDVRSMKEKLFELYQNRSQKSRMHLDSVTASKLRRQGCHNSGSGDSGESNHFGGVTLASPAPLLKLSASECRGDKYLALLITNIDSPAIGRCDASQTDCRYRRYLTYLREQTALNPPAIMFKPTASHLKAFLDVAAQIQRPLSQRESKQLLSILTRSFRQQLDQEHPILDPSSQLSTSKALKANDDRPRTSRPGSVIPDLAATPTERHIHYLLGNPLFSYDPSKNATKSPRRDPMELFEQAVAKGMMTIGHAYACLHAKKAELMESPTTDLRDGMRESGAGLKVVRWLISSGNAEDLVLLQEKHPRFTALLMDYMVAEGLQEIAWSWIEKCYSGISHIVSPLKSLQLDKGKEPEGVFRIQKLTDEKGHVVGPLVPLILSECKGGGSLDSAYKTLFRAKAYFTENRIFAHGHVPWPVVRILVRETLTSRQRPLPSKENFESFIALVAGFPHRNRYRDYCLAHLSLFHPQAPNFEFALEYLQTRAMSDQVKVSSLIPREAGHTDRIIQLALDTAEGLLDNDRSNDARWVLKFLEANYPEAVGVHTQKVLQQLKKEKAEEASLSILDALCV